MAKPVEILITANADGLIAATKQGAEGLDQLRKAAEEAAKAERETAEESERFRQQQEKATAALRYTRDELTQTGASTLKFEGEVTKLSEKLQREVRELGILSKELDQLEQAERSSATAIARKELALDKLTAEIQQVIQKERELETATKNTANATQRSASEFEQIKGKVSGLISTYLGFEAVTRVAAFAFDGFKLGAGIEQSRLAVQTLTGSVERGNAIFEQATAFGQRYGYTQEEMASAAQQAATVFNKTNQTTEKTLEVLGRLASLNPAEGFEGSVVAFKELASGDITSIAERFNIARSEANAMKEAIAAGADPVQVLDSALSKMGVSVDVLANRMQGRNGALLDMKLSMESLSLASGDLLEALNISEGISNFANGVGFLAQGIQFITGDTQKLTDALIDLQVRGFALGSYDQYAQKMTEAGLADEMLSREAYNAAQAMVGKGGAARDVSAAVTSLADAETVLRDMLFQQVQAGELSEEQLNNLVQRTLELAGSSPEATNALLEIVTAMSDNRDGADELTQYLDALAINQEFAASTAYGYADAQVAAYDATVNTTDANDNHTASVYDLTDAEYQNIEAKLEQQVEAEKAAQLERDLAYAYQLSGDGAFGNAAASLYLAKTYDLEAQETSRLIALHNELIKARGGTAGNAAAGALTKALDYGEGRRSGAISAPYEKSKRGGSSGRSGGSSGKSEAVREAEREAKELEKIEEKLNKEFDKANQQREKLERQHAAELEQIWDRWRAEELAATERFNTDKFQDRLEGARSLVEIDQDLWDQAQKMNVDFWDESQRIAQAGDAQKADAFLKAATEYTTMKAQHAQDLRDLDAQIAEEEDAAERQKLEQKRLRLQEIYAEEEKLAGENLEKIRTGQEEIDKARDESLAKENADYTKAQQDLATAFATNVNEVVDSSGKVKDAISEMAARLVSEFDRISAAAVMANGASAASPADLPPVDGSHALGLDRVPFDGYRAELHKDERVLTAQQARDYDRMVVAPPAARGARGNATIVIAPNFNNTTAPRQEVRAASEDLAAMVRKILRDEANTSRKLQRMGG